MTTTSTTSTTSPASDVQRHRYAELEFTEDPFQDVNFSDPFASHSDDPFAPTSNNMQKSKVSANLDPFAMEKDPFAPSNLSNLSNGKSIQMDFDSSFGSPSIWADDLQLSVKNMKITGASPKLSEEDQIAWASSDSVRLEQERLRKAELQETADLEMAIALSKSEVEHRMIAEDRLI